MFGIDVSALRACWFLFTVYRWLAPPAEDVSGLRPCVAVWAAGFFQVVAGLKFDDVGMREF